VQKKGAVPILADMESSRRLNGRAAPAGGAQLRVELVQIDGGVPGRALGIAVGQIADRAGVRSHQIGNGLERVSEGLQVENSLFPRHHGASLRHSVTLRQRHPVTPFRENTGMAIIQSNRVVETVGTRLRAERQIQKVTRRALSEVSGIPYSTIADIENGNQDSSTRLHDLCRAFPKPLRVAWLADGSGAKYAPRETADGEELKQAYHGVWLTRAGALLAAEWEKLDVADRAEIEGQILTRVAKLKRHERSQSKDRPMTRENDDGE
jgi:transcriptional regulator with XRE-family HTH domain